MKTEAKELQMKEETKELLKIVSDFDGTEFNGAYNIREDGGCAGRKSTENITIESKEDKPRHQHPRETLHEGGERIHPRLHHPLWSG